MYDLMCEQLRALTEGEDDLVSNLANASALIFESMDRLNWAGFYLTKEEKKPDGSCSYRLQLGPFQGKTACIRIPFGKGVCGTAAELDETQLVEDVHKFPGHIACDGASNSEIVVPIHKDGRVFGVLDIDSPVFSRFDEKDREGLENFVRVLERGL